MVLRAPCTLHRKEIEYSLTLLLLLSRLLSSITGYLVGYFHLKLKNARKYVQSTREGRGREDVWMAGACMHVNAEPVEYLYESFTRSRAWMPCVSHGLVFRDGFD
jgi:hypothetical protein